MALEHLPAESTGHVTVIHRGRWLRKIAMNGLTTATERSSVGLNKAG